jgi:hypothetical protein
MIPQLDEDGYWPAGLHVADLDEVQRRFAIFTTSDRRIQMFEKLKGLIAEAERSGIVKRIVIGRSFVTAKAEPEDVDCLLILKTEVANQSELLPAQYALISTKRVRQKFQADLFPLLEGSARVNEMLDLFQRRKENPHLRRGIIEVLIGKKES